jgi:hypothetical protein
VVKAKADGPAVVEIAVNDRTQEVTIPQGDWTELSLKAVPLSQGANQLKVRVKSGVAHLDWISLQ